MRAEKPISGPICNFSSFDLTTKTRSSHITPCVVSVCFRCISKRNFILLTISGSLFWRPFSFRYYERRKFRKSEIYSVKSSMYTNRVFRRWCNRCQSATVILISKVEVAFAPKREIFCWLRTLTKAFQALTLQGAERVLKSVFNEHNWKCLISAAFLNVILLATFYIWL